MNISNLNIFDLIILLGALQGIFFAIFLLNQKAENKLATRFLAFFILGFALNSIFNSLEGLGLRQELTFWEFVPLYCSLFITASFYLFVDFTVKPEQKFTAKKALWFVPFAFQFGMQIFMLILFFTNKSAIYENLSSMVKAYNLIDSFGVIFGLGILISAIFKINNYERDLRKNYSEINEISLSWLKKLIFGLFGVWFLFAVPTIYEQVTDKPSIEIFYPMWIATSILIYWVGYSAYFRKDFFNVKMFHREIKEEVKTLSDKTAPYYQRLLQLMETEKPYLNPDLNLQMLADSLQLSSGYLSQIINQYEEKNFFDFVNGYRVETVKKMLPDEAFSHLSLLGVAYEAGFKSKSTFNLAFKKLTGVTPSAFKKGVKK